MAEQMRRKCQIIGVRATLRLVGLLVLMAMLVSAAASFQLFACGPFFWEATFVGLAHPDQPWLPFFEGELGVIRPTFWRAHLFVAYRYLSGRPLTPVEIEGVKGFWNRRPFTTETSGRSAVEEWQELRVTLGGAPTQPPGLYRGIDYSYFLNCTDSAFHTAAKTLRDRMLRFGASSSEVRAWVEAQDQVFDNCTTPGEIPQAASSDLDPLIRHDRQYQIGSALFYALRWDEAERIFEEISNTQDSPWRTLAHLLVARTRIRRATLEAPSVEPFIPSELRRALEKLQAIVNDPSLAEWHDAARDLEAFVRIRLEPERTLEEISQRLLSGKSGSRLTQDLVDFSFLMDRNIAAENELVLWIRNFQHATREAAVRVWRENPSVANLIAAAAKSTAASPESPQLLEALALVPEASPAFLTTSLLRIGLLASGERRDQARELADGILLKPLSPSERNLFLEQRFALSESLDELRGYAARLPAQVSYGLEPLRTREPEKLLFDQDASQLLTERLPLSALLELAGNNPWPEPLAAEVAQAAWTRAVLLENWGAALEMTSRLRAFFPEAQTSLMEFEAAATDREKRFLSTLTLLRMPGWHAYVSAGPLRETPAHRIDNLRHNWWCGFGRRSGPYDHYQIGVRLPEGVSPHQPPARLEPAFLSESEKQAASLEWNRLEDLGPAPNLMAQRVLDHALGHPNDARLPEALHRAVKATRFGCTDVLTTEYSRQAYQRLHRLFPNSPWAKRTPYWY